MLERHKKGKLMLVRIVGLVIVKPARSWKRQYHKPKDGLSLNLKPGGNCKSRSIVYAGKCDKFKVLYICHSGNEMCESTSTNNINKQLNGR